MVKVYRLITKNTYEAQMFEKSSKKLGLDQAVLSKINKTENGEGKIGPAGLEKNEIESLLKYGAYDLLNKEDDDKFCEEDIDKILEKRSRTVVHSSGASENSSFSKVICV
jgi:hypothetical protein